jgi:hypothetical protein
MKKVIYMIALLLGATTMAQTITVNGTPMLVSDDISFPFWLESGSSISPEVPVSSISVLEFNIVPNNNGNDMVFNQVISVTEAQTVPEGKAWKVESVLVENQGFSVDSSNISLDSAFVASMIAEAILNHIPDIDTSFISELISNQVSLYTSIGVGDHYKGGIVGYIFESGDVGYVEGETHGYIVHYNNSSIGWGCLGLTTAIGVNYTSVGNGMLNTENLVNTCTEPEFAAKYCYDLAIGLYDDWFLPNYGEISLIPDVIWELLNVSEVWISQEAILGTETCSGGCCNSFDYAIRYTPNYNSFSYNRKMPGGGYQDGVNCSGWGGSRVLAFRQF